MACGLPSPVGATAMVGPPGYSMARSAGNRLTAAQGQARHLIAREGVRRDDAEAGARQGLEPAEAHANFSLARQVYPMCASRAAGALSVRAPFDARRARDAPKRLLLSGTDPSARRKA